MRWTYMRFPVIPDRGGPNVVALDHLGDEGWELVCYVPDHEAMNGATGRSGGYLLFKRPKLTEDDAAEGEERALRWVR